MDKDYTYSHNNPNGQGRNLISQIKTIISKIPAKQAHKLPDIIEKARIQTMATQAHIQMQGEINPIYKAMKAITISNNALRACDTTQSKRIDPLALKARRGAKFNSGEVKDYFLFAQESSNLENKLVGKSFDKVLSPVSSYYGKSNSDVVDYKNFNPVEWTYDIIDDS